MPPKPSLSASFARLSVRGLQTTAPLPPPTTPLPPSAAASTSASSASASASSSSSSAISHLPPLIPASSSSSSELPSSTSSAISLIESQSTPSTGRYILARLHARTYLLHPKDVLTLPTLKPVQSPGTALNLTRILEVGSREYALRSQAANPTAARRSIASELRQAGTPGGAGGEEWKLRKLTRFDSIPQDLVQCQLTVLEHTKSPIQRILKKKRRKGYKKTIEHKQGWTRLRVGDIFFNGEAQS